jgi:hypothetical protein
MRRALFAVAFISGLILSLWRLESWEWLYSGSLLAALVMVAYLVVRGDSRENVFA